jgi:multidrug efflux pump subunit AcrA (membrane-fusion protein)
MRAKVSFLSRPVKQEEEKPRTVVNPAAVVTNDGKSKVFIVQEGKVKEVSVTLGPALGDMVEVLSGVKSGDRVVVKPPKRLKDGSRIKIRKSDGRRDNTIVERSESPIAGQRTISS